MKKGKDFWGPPIWITFHILSLVLRDGEGKYLTEFMWLLTKLLPCEYCKANLTKKLKRYPPEPYMTSSQKAFLYSYIVHDLANQHITQKSKETKISPPFDNVLGYYLSSLESQGANFWGPPIWTSIHIFAVTLSPENAKYYKKLLHLLTRLLPDDESRASLATVLERHPIDPFLRTNHDAFYYSYKLHDAINKKLGKKSPSYEDVKTFYFSSLGEECNDCKV